MLPLIPYWSRKNAISTENCRRIIELGSRIIAAERARGGTTCGTTFGESHKGAAQAGDQAAADRTLEDLADGGLAAADREQAHARTYIRDCELCFLTDDWIYDLIYPLVVEANTNAGWRYEFDYAEPLQFTVYHPGNFYGWHIDGHTCHHSVFRLNEPGMAPPAGDKLPRFFVRNPQMAGKVRKLSVTLNLSPPNSYEGGNLKFDFGPHARVRFHECEEARPQGSAVVFPSYMYHQVTPVTHGTRYSMVLWALGQPFR